MAEGPRLRNLVDRDAFHVLVYLNTQQAARLRFCVSVVCLSIGGGSGEASSPLTRHIAEVATTSLRATDVVTTLSPTCIALLLVDAESSALSRILERVTESLRRPYRFRGRDWNVTWSAGGACFPQTAMDFRELLQQATDLMVRASEEGIHGLCLAG